MKIKFIINFIICSLLFNPSLLKSNEPEQRTNFWEEKGKKKFK